MKLFRTEINPQQTCPERLNWQELFISLGSCFADKTSLLLKKSGVQVYSNPTGVLYNPKSIANLICDSLDKKKWPEDSLINHKNKKVFPYIQGSPNNPIQFIENAQMKLSEHLNKANVLLVTFGTAWAYQLKGNQKVVANCHKLPSELFDRHILDQQIITQTWANTLKKIQSINPDIKTIFTVSPVRHLRDNFRENQISKSTLHLAIENIIKCNKNCYYFPAYEIMMDELRDYRFYSPDMTHPSDEATEYILEKFIEASFDQESHKYFLEAKKISQICSHNLLNPESEESEKFIISRQNKINAFNKKYPSSLLGVNV